MGLECLNNIIGITAEDCPCIMNGTTQAERAELAASVSGLYTDNCEGGVHLKAVKSVEDCKKFAQIALKAKREAIKRVGDDLIIMLNQKYAKNKSHYVGRIGNETISGAYTTGKRFAGIRIKPNHISDAVLRVTGGSVAFTAAGSIDIQVYRALVNASAATLIHTETAQLSNGGVVGFQFAQELVLPLQVAGDAVEYYFVYDVTTQGGAQPMNTKVSCGCGDAERQLKEYVQVDGIWAQDMANITGDFSLHSFSNGITLEVKLKCENNAFICREYNENDAVALVLAYAAMYKASELLIEYVMQSPEVNRYTMMNREFLWGKRNHFRAEYEARIKYLGADDVVNITGTDCYICKDDKMFYAGITA